MDEQHRGMFGAINTFHYLLTKHYSLEECKRALSLMIDYTHLHIFTEEMLMQRSSYPGYEEQVQQHKDMLETTEKFTKQHNIEKQPEHILIFLKNSWVNHMRNEDQKYVKYIQREGTKLGLDSNIFIKWNQDYNSGINLLDGQHRGIVSCINSLYYFFKMQCEEKPMQSIFNLIVNYGDVHFKTEESVMFASKGYPFYEDHLKQHENLRIQIKDILDDFSNNRDSNNVLKFLKQWWIGHIKEEVISFKKYGVSTKPIPPSS